VPRSGALGRRAPPACAPGRCPGLGTARGCPGAVPWAGGHPPHVPRGGARGWAPLFALSFVRLFTMERCSGACGCGLCACRFTRPRSSHMPLGMFMIKMRPWLLNKSISSVVASLSRKLTEGVTSVSSSWACTRLSVLVSSWDGEWVGLRGSSGHPLHGAKASP